jgi:DNA-binding beta-propeller fold protein YncE
VFTDSGVYLREWGSPGSGPGQFDRPDGLAIDAAGNAYVADKFNRRIQKFANDGTFLAQWGGYGTGDGQFAGPVRVAIGPQGDVYVVDNLNRRVQAFTAEGVFITKSGTGTSTWRTRTTAVSRSSLRGCRRPCKL